MYSCVSIGDLPSVSTTQVVNLSVSTTNEVPAVADFPAVFNAVVGVLLFMALLLLLAFLLLLESCCC
jgi:hypothetical protein